MTLCFPDPDWRVDAPETHGLSERALKAAAEVVFGVEKRYGFLVVHRGAIVHETYARDAAATCPIFSLTKSFAAALVGIAVTREELRLDDRVADWLPVHHADIAPGAEIRHVVTMTAGRDPAGSWFAYNSAEILNSLPGILWLASGLSPRDFYVERLKKPLGLGFDWPHNERGWCQIGSQGPLPVIRATHRDVARLGLLWLAGGRWKGETIVSPDFVTESLTPQFPDVNAAYGYLWWLNSDAGTWRMPTGPGRPGRFIPDAPANLYMAMGARGKLMYVVPDHDLVVVTMGDTDGPQSGPFVHRIWQAISTFLPARASLREKPAR